MRSPQRTRRCVAALATASGLAFSASACIPVNSPVTLPPPPPAAPAPALLAPWPIMGPSMMNAAQLTAWYNSKRITGATPTVPVAVLAQYYIEEGQAEGVAGDLAFTQAMLETGWLRFSQRMPGTFNNFAGIGAVDGGTSASSFPDARTGVRAHVQYLKAYATRNVTRASFVNPIASPRLAAVMTWVSGRATLWTQMGNGNWATDPGYSAKIDSLYRSLASYSGVKVK